MCTLDIPGTGSLLQQTENGRHRHHRQHVTTDSPSPTGSPRSRHRKHHRHGNHNSHGSPSVAVPNGHIPRSDDTESGNHGDDWSDGDQNRLQDNLNLVEGSLSTSPAGIAAVPRIECSPKLARSNSSLQRQDDTAGDSNTSHSEDGISTEAVQLDIHQPAQSSEASDVSNHGDRDAMVTDSMGAVFTQPDMTEAPAQPAESTEGVPPPLPPRNYRVKHADLSNRKSYPLAANKINNRADRKSLERTVSGSDNPARSFPPRENQASFDSLHAYAGSRENLTRHISSSSSSDNQSSTDHQLGSVGEENTGERPQTDLTASHCGTEAGGSEIATQQGSDSQGAAAAGCDPESVTNPEAASPPTESTPVVTRTRSGLGASSMAAQLARIPNIESAVSSSPGQRFTFTLDQMVHPEYEVSSKRRSEPHLHYVDREGGDTMWSNKPGFEPTSAQLVVTAQAVGQETSSRVASSKPQVCLPVTGKPAIPPRPTSKPLERHPAPGQLASESSSEDSSLTLSEQSALAVPASRTSHSSSSSGSEVDGPRWPVRNESMCSVSSESSVTSSSSEGIAGPPPPAMSQLLRHRGHSEEDRDVPHPLQQWQHSLSQSTESPPPTPPPREGRDNSPRPPVPPPRDGSKLSTETHPAVATVVIPPTPPPRVTPVATRGSDPTLQRQAIQRELLRWHQQQQGQGQGEGEGTPRETVRQVSEEEPIHMELSDIVPSPSNNQRGSRTAEIWERRSHLEQLTGSAGGRTGKFCLEQLPKKSKSCMACLREDR